MELMKTLAILNKLKQDVGDDLSVCVLNLLA